MTIQQVQYILTVYQTGSISKAAAKLYLAQPNLSSAIQALEQEIGVQIFTRTNRGTVPTEKGRQVLETAKQLYENYLRMMRVARESEPIQIRIGCTPHRPLCQAYLRLCQMYQDAPWVQLTYGYYMAEELLEMLYLAKLDVAVITAPYTWDITKNSLRKRLQDRGIEARQIATVPAVLRLGPKHPLYHRKTVTLAEVRFDALGVYGGPNFTQSSIVPDAERVMQVADIQGLDELVAQSSVYTIGLQLPEAYVQ